MKLDNVPHNIILVGFMGTGKTVVGHALARNLKYSYIDTDDMIEEVAGKSIPRIFAEDGEAHFREIEKSVIRELADLDKHVVATGGGAVIFDDNIEEMKRAGVVICLDAHPDVVYDRVKDDEYRPLLQVPNPRERIAELLDQRHEQYIKADMVIDTSELGVEEVVERILQRLHSVSGE